MFDMIYQYGNYLHYDTSTGQRVMITNAQYSQLKNKMEQIRVYSLYLSEIKVNVNNTTVSMSDYIHNLMYNAEGIEKSIDSIYENRAIFKFRNNTGDMNRARKNILKNLIDIQDTLAGR